MENSSINPASFRDPGGFVFYRENTVYRQINKCYKENYDLLIETGLYKALVDNQQLLSHEEDKKTGVFDENCYKVIKPETVPFISYPYEWCFSQLKDAALLTLEIQRKALCFGMSLKDSSAYNVQFVDGKPIFIDTLSFEKYQEGQIWPAYRQFCQHFLGPLVLMSYQDVRLNKLFQVYIDGIPLDLTSKLLPIKTWFQFSLFSHLHLHAKSQVFFSDKKTGVREQRMTKVAFLGLIDNLFSVVSGLQWKPKGTEWAEYYQDTNYSQEAFQHKKELVIKFLDKMNPSVVWDLGANTGIFSRISSQKGIVTVSFDADAAVVEKSYQLTRESKERKILSLFMDLINLSPSIGWENEERRSLMERGPADMVFALALVHHLTISHNLPISKIASFLNKICCHALIVEWVPKQDSQVQKLLFTRKDVFTEYNQEVFEREFAKHFIICYSVKIKDSQRVLYCMEKIK